MDESRAFSAKERQKAAGAGAVRRTVYDAVTGGVELEANGS